MVAIGDRFSDILSAIIGNWICTYFTKAGQQELSRKPFSASSFDSACATISAPSAASTTVKNPSSLRPEITCPSLAYVNWLDTDGATRA